MPDHGTFTRAEDLDGVLGLPMPVAELSRSRWDALIVGAGHNGLTCAAYLARAGLRVLVLESRRRVGGACTVEEVWPDVRVSPCAYLCGLLHPRVIDDLNLRARGFRWIPASAGMFVPFDDGRSIQLWDDDDRCDDEIRRFAPGDVAGRRAMSALIGRIRDALRPAGDRDLWLGPPPSRDEIETRLRHDPDAVKMLFEWSRVEYVERFLDDESLQAALLGQGVIGTNASPFDPGTASIHWHHASGRMGGHDGMWGYVEGGMGRVSMLLCDAAREAGAVVATGVAVGRIVPGQGVELEGGERIDAPVVISNADPRATLRLLGDAADPAWRARVESIPIEGCTLKLNVALRELPSFRARPGTLRDHHFGQINTPLSKAEWRAGFEAARSGRLPSRLWTELYFQTAHDASVAPAGVHTMSVFAQYVPYRFADGAGTWDSRRDDARALAIDAVARHCDNLPGAVIDAVALGPPDIEREVGLTGGHIFQGECLPGFMWDRRLAAETSMPGVYLCGAATYPGGSVIAVNGRNAAVAVLASRASKG